MVTQSADKKWVGNPDKWAKQLHSDFYFCFLSLRWNVVSGCVWGCLWKRLAFESVGSLKHITLTNMSGHHSIVWEPKENKEAEQRQIFSMLDLNIHLLPSYIGTRGSWVFRLRPGFTALALLVFRPLGMDKKCAISFPGLLACRWHIMELLSLLNHWASPS